MVAAFTSEEESDGARMGDIGTLSGSALDYAPAWALADRGIPLSDIEAEWTFDRMAAFSDYARMKSDYQSAWTEFYRRQAESRRKGG